MQYMADIIRSAVGVRLDVMIGLETRNEQSVNHRMTESRKYFIYSLMHAEEIQYITHLYATHIRAHVLVMSAN